MSYNILVIDDEVKMVERLMNGLRRADSLNTIGTIKIDDSILSLKSVEEYDVSRFSERFDVALIDYQLYSSFTGVLVSAWFALYLNIPRIALTTAPYNGNPVYFNASILKNEITDNPQNALDKIINCIMQFDSEQWLEQQHQQLVSQYQEVLESNTEDSSTLLSKIELLLDKFEKLLDAHQEENLKRVLLYEDEARIFLEHEKENNQKMVDLQQQINMYLEELKCNE